MIVNLENIEQKKIFVPEIWKHNWEKLINSSSGVEQELLVVQARAANILKKINETKFNFARMAWINLWTKSFNILDGIINSVNCNSDLTMELLSRVIIEYELHVFTIFEHPIYLSKKNSNIKFIHKDEIRKAEYINRLRAYAAWCLYCDKEYVEFCINPKILNAIYDSTPSKNYIDGFENAEQLEKFENLFDVAPVDLDEKSLKNESIKIRTYGENNLDYIENLLKNNIELKDWHNKILQILNNKKNVSFYELFNETESSICKKLDKLGMKFGYTSYKLGSMYMHGSTFAHFFLTDNESIAPKISVKKDILERSASYIGQRCNSMFVFLALIQKGLWKEDSKQP